MRTHVTTVSKLLAATLVLAGSGYWETQAATVPESLWQANQPGFVVEAIAGGLQLPVDLAFVPNAGTTASSPWCYVTELYGNVKVILRDGTVRTYASGLLNYSPTDPLPGTGEQGVTGVVVEPATGDVLCSVVYAAGGAHHPKIVRLHSTDGGLSATTRATLLDMPGLAITNAHGPSNLTLGPDGKLYVHVGDGGTPSLALNQDSFGGKILRVNLDGSAPSDNPFFNAADGITAKDYVYAYGLRNPFGGSWRAVDGKHYEVENGPTIDRFVQVMAGTSYGYNGTDPSMGTGALYNWIPAHAPVNVAFIQASTFGGSGFPASAQDHAFITEYGPGYVNGPSGTGKRITEFVIDASGHLVSGPTPLIAYAGSGRATAVGLAAGPDGLYFTDLYRDDGNLSTAAGAHVLRVRYLGTSPVLPTVSIVATDPIAKEQGAKPGLLTVSRTGSTAASLPVAYVVSGSSAPGSDYVPLSGIVVIPAGVASATITVTPIDNSTGQLDHTVVATLAPSAAYTVGTPASATVTILDNDPQTIATVAIDQEVSAQTITGIGGNFAIGRFDGSDQPNDAVGELTMRELHPTHARIGIPLKGWAPNPPAAGESHAVYHGDGRVGNVFLLMRELARRRIPIVASVWDAPDWMVVNPGNTTQRRLADGMDAAFVDAIAAFLAHAADAYGVTVRSVSVNEANGGFSLLLTPAHAASLVKLGGAEFEARGLATDWLAGDASDSASLPAFARPMLEDAEARPFFSALAQHSWDANATDSVFTQVAGLAQAFHLPVWATEVGYDALANTRTPSPFATWDNAWHLAQVSYRLLHLSQASVLDYWSYQNDFPLADAHGLYPAGFVVKQLTDHLSPGSQVVSAVSSDATVWPLAAVQEPRNEFMTQLINVGPKPARVTIAGLPDGRLDLVRTSATDHLRDIGSYRPAAGHLTVTLPAQSISTLFGRLQPGRANRAPVVQAGGDQSLAVTVPAMLAGTVRDDGLPIGSTITSTWSQLGGPGLVTFADAHALATTATFSAPGVYRLQLAASDGELVGSDSVTVSVLSGDHLHVNFQRARSPVPAGYVPDFGNAFAARGNGFTYGWNRDNFFGRDRNSPLSPDQRYDTLTYLQKPGNPQASWEAAVANGTYLVHVVAGDADAIDSHYRLAVEGVLAIDGTPTVAKHWLEGTVQVVVGDGRLTITSTAGAVNNKLCFVDIDRLADLPVIAFHQAASAITEGSASPASIQVELNHAYTLPVTVAYAITGGTAQTGADYAPLPAGTLTFAPGETAKTLALSIIDDAVYEPDETVVFGLSAPTNGTLGQAIHTLTIHDNETQPTVAFAQATSTRAETAGTVTFSVALSGPSSLPASVAYAITGGTALAGTNYQPLAAGTLSFPPGTIAANLSLTLLDDHLHTTDRTVVLGLSSPVGTTLGASATHVLTITDADPIPTVAFAQPTSAHAETDGAVTIPVALSGPSGLPVTVSYAVSGGTAVAGTNYQTIAPGTLTIAPGATTAVIPVTLLDDHRHDPSTTLQLTLSAPGGATLGSPVIHTLTIADADPLPTVAFAQPVATYAETAGTVTIPVTLSAVSGFPVTVAYAVSGGTAVAGTNFQTLPPGTLTIPAGQLSGSITLSLLDDHLHTAGRTVALTLSAPTGATLGATATETVTIADADPAPTVAFAAAVQAVDQTAGTIAVAVDLSAVSGLPAQVAVGPAAGGAGSALPGIDYQFTPVTLTIPAGATMASLPLTVLNSGHTDDRTVILALTNPQGTAVGTPATIVITLRGIGAPPQPTVAFTQATGTAAETAGTVAIPVALSAASTQDVTVAYAVTGGTAVASTNYQPLPAGTLVIPAGAITGSIPLTLLDNHRHDAGSTVVLSLSAPVNATLGAQASTTFTISDADPLPVVAFTAAASSVTQNAGAITLPVALAPVSGLPATVDYALGSGSTAVAGADFAFTPGTLTIAAGATAAAVPITVLNSGHADDRTVVLTLVNPQEATLGVPATYTLTLTGTGGVTLPVVAFQAPAAAAVESQTTVTIPVVLDQPATTNVTVTYHVSGGTATNGDPAATGTDYTLPDGTLTIPAGQTQGVITFSVINDNIAEPDETVIIQLANPTGATLGAGSTFTYTILNDDLPAPVVTYTATTSTTADVFGTVPDSFGITNLVVTIVSPASVVSFSGSAQNGLFHAHIDNANPPVAGATFTIAFMDSTHRTGPATTVTVPFGNGSGGGTTSGDPSTLPPDTPTVSLDIASGLTGVQMETIDGTLIHFTKNDQVTVTVSASTSLGTITDVTLFSSDGQVIPVSGGTVTLSTPTEGLFQLTASATATNGGQSATGSTDTAVSLQVDKTKPVLNYKLAKRYWPSTVDQSADPPPFVPMRHSLTDDHDLVYLNKNADSDNKPLREQRFLNMFDRAGFTSEADVDDASGLRTDTTQTADAKDEEGGDVALTVSVNPPLDATRGDPQTATISGFSGLPDSVEFDGLNQTSARGRHTLHVVLEDRAGNQLDEDEYRLWVKRVAPTAQVGIRFGVSSTETANGRNNDGRTDISPARYIASTSDAMEGWQDTRDDAHQLLLLTTQATVVDNFGSTTGFASFWLLKSAVDVPSDSPVQAHVLMRDRAGNLSDVIDVPIQRRILHADQLTTSSADLVPWELSADVIYGIENPVARDAGSTTDAFLWQVFGGTRKPVPLIPHGGNVDGWLVPTKQPDDSFVITDVGTRDATDDHIAHTVVTVAPLDPGTDAARRFAPAVLTIPPSWLKSPPKVTVQVRDPGIASVRSTGSINATIFVPMLTPSSPSGGTSLTAGPGPSADSLTATLDLRRTIDDPFAPTPPPGQPRPQLVASSPGVVRIHYDVVPTATPPQNSNYNFLAYFPNAAYRWCNLVSLEPDVVAAGRRTTIRIAGGFVDETFSPSSFDPKGDYVHFLNNGSDATQKAADYSPGADPSTLAGKIVILGQRFLADGPGADSVQALELDLAIGSDLIAGTYDVDVRLGGVRAFTDTLSQANQGSSFNGGSSHRMKQALYLYGVRLEQDNGDGNFQPGFDIERTRPLVTVSTPYDGATVQASEGSGSITVNVAGSVHDYVGQLTGTNPTLTVNGQAMALSGGNGDYSFSGQAILDGTNLIRASATNAFGVRGTREVVIGKRFNNADAIPPSTPPQAPGSGPWVYATHRYEISGLSGSPLTSFTLAKIDVISGQVSTVAMSFIGTAPSSDPSNPPERVYASMDQQTLLRVSAQSPGAAGHLAEITGTVTELGTSGSTSTDVDLLQAGIGATVYRSQAVNVSLAFNLILDPGVVDAGTVILYKPFAPTVTAALTETGPGTYLFTGSGGISVQLFGTDIAETVQPVALVTCPALGLTTMPVLVARESTDPNAGALQASQFTSGSLVLQTADGSTPVSPDLGSYSYLATVIDYPDMLSPQRAKRLAIDVGHGVSASMLAITGTATSSVSFSAQGNQLVSDALAFDPILGGGDHTITGWPVKWDGTVTGDPPKPLAIEDDPDVIKVGFKVEGHGVPLSLYVRRVPDKTANAIKITQDMSLGGPVSLTIPSQPKPGVNAIDLRGRQDLFAVTVDDIQLRFLKAVAATWDGNQFSDSVRLDSILTGQELADLQNLNTVGFPLTPTWRIPLTLTGWRDASAGFAVGALTEVVSSINPIEILRSLVAMASIDWSQISPGDVVREAFLGEFKAAMEAQQRSDWYEWGVHCGRSLVFYATLVVPIGPGAAKVAAKLTKVLREYKLVIKPEIVGTIGGNIRIERRFPIAKYTYKKLIPGPARQRAGAETIITKETIKPRGAGRDRISVKDEDIPGFGGEEAGHDRGHLIADSLGGRADLPENFVTMFAKANREAMNKAEQVIWNLANDGKVVKYKVTPIYENAASEIPRGITLEAWVDREKVPGFPITIRNVLEP